MPRNIFCRPHYFPMASRRDPLPHPHRRGGAVTWCSRSMPGRAGQVVGEFDVASGRGYRRGRHSGCVGDGTSLLEPAFTAERLVFAAAVFEADCVLVWPADAVCESVFATPVGCGAERTGGCTAVLACGAGRNRLRFRRLLSAGRSSGACGGYNDCGSCWLLVCASLEF